MNVPNPSLADCHQQDDKNFPLIITGDEGCGRTHTIIKWLSQRNRKEDRVAEEESSFEESSGHKENLDLPMTPNQSARSSAASNSKKVITSKAKRHPNICDNGDVLLTFFAGIETINSRVQLKSLTPKTTAKSSTSKQSAPAADPAGSSGHDRELTKYQTFIYNIMTLLRQIYKVDKRVEILNDQLRTNFRRWLELANKLHKETMERNTQIIMILDGAEKFMDEFGQEESADWIPIAFPEKFKVIISVQRKSKAMKHFIMRKYPIMLLNGFRSEQNFVDLCAPLEVDLQQEVAFFEKIKKLINFDSQANVQILSRKMQLKHEAEAE